MAILPFTRLCVPLAAFLARSNKSSLVIRSLSSRTMATTTTDAAAAASSSITKPVVQYIFLRRDLDWPAGAMAAQAAHVSVAAVTQALSSTNSAEAAHYVAAENLPHMTKYVYGVDTLKELQDVRTAWNQLIRSTSTTTDSIAADDDLESLQSYWWVEQPEDIPSAFGTWPVQRTNKVSKFVKKLNLSYF